MKISDAVNFISRGSFLTIKSDSGVFLEDILVGYVKSYENGDLFYCSPFPKDQHHAHLIRVSNIKKINADQIVVTDKLGRKLSFKLAPKKGSHVDLLKRFNEHLESNKALNSFLEREYESHKNNVG